MAHEDITEPVQDIISRRTLVAGSLFIALGAFLSGCATEAEARNGSTPSQELEDNLNEGSGLSETDDVKGDRSSPPETGDVKLDINQDYPASDLCTQEDYEKELELMGYLPEGSSLWKRDRESAGSSQWDYYIAVEPGSSDTPREQGDGAYLVIGQFGAPIQGFGCYGPERYGISDYLEYSKSLYASEYSPFLQQRKEAVLSGTDWRGAIYADEQLAGSPMGMGSYIIYGVIDCKAIHIATRL
jgi:hypothetical protein